MDGDNEDNYDEISSIIADCGVCGTSPVEVRETVLCW